MLRRCFDRHVDPYARENQPGGRHERRPADALAAMDHHRLAAQKRQLQLARPAGADRIFDCFRQPDPATSGARRRAKSVVGRIWAAKDWAGDFEDTDPQWLALKDWRVAGTEHEEWAAKAILNFEGEEDAFGVTTLCGAGAGRAGFWWVFEYKNLTGKVAWKKFAVGVHQRYELREKFGFEYVSDVGEWFLPFKLDPELVATAYETEDWAAALKPVSDALEKVDAALPTFTAIINDAKAAFKPT